ncbi:hypothetical protein D3C72_2338540 [compost metagenome]
MISFLLALWECISRQKSPSRLSTSRRCTTSRAAIFSETNNTDLPAAISSAIMFVMV